MQTLPVKILGTGVYLPKTMVTAEELDRRACLPDGWTKKHSGVLTRHFVADETASLIGPRAVKNALTSAGLNLAVQEGRLQRGDKALLLGPSAGFSVGGLALEF